MLKFFVINGILYIGGGKMAEFKIDLSKKTAPLCILEILKEHTDSFYGHSLTISEICSKLQTDYGLDLNRKTVSNTLSELKYFFSEYEDHEYCVCCTEKNVATRYKDGEEYVVSKSDGWYISRDFSDAELRLLIDGLLFSKHLPNSHCRALSKKLEKLSSKYFKARIKHIDTMIERSCKNKQLFYTVEILDEAIDKERQVSFSYCSFNTDKKLCPRLASDGSIRSYIINPYQMVAANGRYYLIANYDKYDNIAHYRLDYITDIKLLDTPAKDKSLLVDYKNGFNLPRHMAEHFYMYTGSSITVTFHADKTILNDLFDWFSDDMIFSNETDKTVDVTVKANQDSMLFWSLQYGRYIEVINPPDFREKIAEVIGSMAEKYKTPK